MNKYSDATLTAPADFLSVSRLTRGDMFDLLALSRELRGRSAGAGALQNRSIVMIFEKPSLRTRVTFEVAIRQLGGWPVLLGPAESKLGERESVPDFARNLSLWVDGIVARVFSQDSLEELARHATVPVVNALSGSEHPCQALADILTLSEVWDSFAGKELVYVGDWNNVSRSLAQASRLAGLKFRAVCPEAYGPAAAEGVDWSTDPDAVYGASAVYTDVWASMGQEDELAERKEIFRPYQVNETMMAKTGQPAFFMHCLPAHRGLEVTDSVIESGCSLVFHQAANRLPVEKAILVTLMENKNEEEHQEGRAGVLGRPGHLDHHSLAQGKLWM